MQSVCQALELLSRNVSQCAVCCLHEKTCLDFQSLCPWSNPLRSRNHRKRLAERKALFFSFNIRIWIIALWQPQVLFYHSRPARAREVRPASARIQMWRAFGKSLPAVQKLCIGISGSRKSQLLLAAEILLSEPSRYNMCMAHSIQHLTAVGLLIHHSSPLDQNS